MRLLLVEDSDSLRCLFARVLTRCGYLVYEAANAEAALECLGVFKPEVILTDVMLPVIDGIELIRTLRAMPWLATVPMVAMTADASPEQEWNARAAGANDFIAKPVDGETLVRRLSACSSPGDHFPI